MPIYNQVLCILNLFFPNSLDKNMLIITYIAYSLIPCIGGRMILFNQLTG